MAARASGFKSRASRSSTREVFAYNTTEPPPVIEEAEQYQDEEIPWGRLGMMSDGAALSDNGEDTIGDKRFVDPDDVDVGLPLKRARQVLRKSAMANSHTMMEREVLKEVIEEDMQRWGGCITLPVSILFFVFYLLSVVTHEAVTFTHITTHPIRKKLQEGLDQVTVADDVYTFLQQTYLPFLYAQHDGLGDPLPRDRWSVINQYSQLIGASQMTLQRSVAGPCQEMATFVECYPQNELTGDAFGADPATVSPPVRSVNGKPWALHGNWTWWDWANANPSAQTILQCGDEGFTSTGCASSRRLLDLRFEITSTMPVQSPGSPEYEFVLDSMMPYAALYNRIEYLKQRQWLDAHSTTMVVKSVILNNQYSVPRLIYVNTFFYFSRGGGVFTDVLVEGKAMSLFADSTSYAADFLFVVMLIVRSISTLVQIAKACLNKRRCKSLQNATFVFMFVTLFFSWINILFMVLQEMQLGPVKTSLEAYLMDKTPAMSQVFYEKVGAMWLMASYARPLVAYAMLCFLCQICIALQWQPRLAVVTHTLLACASDLVHYLIVLSLTLAGFALSGMVIFGRRIIDFSDPFSAFAFCFKVAIESEYDWRELSEKEWMTSFTWVVLYLLLVVMLMVNMVLAIIMDVYAEVRMHSGDNMTIFQHLTYIYRRCWYRSQWVNDEELMDQVNEMPQNVTVQEIRQAFPEMHHYQLEFLQEQCQNKASRITRVGLNTSFVSQTVAAIQIGLEEVEVRLLRLKARGWMGKGIEIGADDGREWVKDIFASIAAQHHWIGLTGKHISVMQLRMQGKTMEDEQERMKRMKLAAGRSVKQRGSVMPYEA